MSRNTLLAAALITAGSVLMAIGRAWVSAPLLILGQVLLLLGSRRSSWKLLAGVGFPVFGLCAGWVFLGSAHELFGGVSRYAATMAVATVIYMACLALDAWAVRRLPRPVAPLLFPALRIPIEVAAAVGGPFGVWGSFAAPAAGLWPISGLAAVGGFSLLSFVLLWLASSAALFWQGLLTDRRPRAWLDLAPCLAVLAVSNLVLGLTSPRSGDTLRVGAVAAPQLSIAYDWANYPQLVSYGRGQLPPDAMARLRPALMDTATQTLRLVTTAAKRGAKIVYTGEGDVKTFDLDVPVVEAMASQTAQANHIWLGLGVVEFRRDPRPYANRILLFAPDGRLVSSYEKRHPIGEEVRDMLIGDGRPASIQTPWAKIAGLICYDTEFVSYTRSLARTGPDMLFAPSNDWPEIAAIRAAITRYRPIETGMSLVRPTRNGISEIVAPDGHLLAVAPYDARTGVVLVANAPARANPTLYTRLGDWPGPASAVLLLGLLAAAIRSDRAGRRRVPA